MGERNFKKEINNAIKEMEASGKLICHTYKKPYPIDVKLKDHEGCKLYVRISYEWVEEVKNSILRELFIPLSNRRQKFQAYVRRMYCQACIQGDCKRDGSMMYFSEKIITYKDKSEGDIYKDITKTVDTMKRRFKIKMDKMERGGEFLDCK